MSNNKDLQDGWYELPKKDQSKPLLGNWRNPFADNQPKPERTTIPKNPGAERRNVPQKQPRSK